MRNQVELGTCSIDNSWKEVAAYGALHTKKMGPAEYANAMRRFHAGAFLFTTRADRDEKAAKVVQCMIKHASGKAKPLPPPRVWTTIKHVGGVSKTKPHVERAEEVEDPTDAKTVPPLISRKELQTKTRAELETLIRTRVNLRPRGVDGKAEMIGLLLGIPVLPKGEGWWKPLEEKVITSAVLSELLATQVRYFIRAADIQVPRCPPSLTPLEHERRTIITHNLTRKDVLAATKKIATAYRERSAAREAAA